MRRVLLVIVGARALAGCVASVPRAELGYERGYDRPFAESAVIQKDGKCQVRCARYGDVTKYVEYRC
jgi:hypothetical protein